MISLPFPRRRKATIDALYGMIVAQARSPSFYRDYGVPDTVDGRLDMILLHLVLVLKFGAVGTASSAGKLLYDRFCQDIDGNFREMGVGDLAVPKRMRRVAEAFFGRQKAYDTAMAADDADALTAAIARNVFGVTEPPLGAHALAAYMRDAAHRLAAQGEGAISDRKPNFPEPQLFAPTATQGTA